MSYYRSYYNVELEEQPVYSVQEMSVDLSSSSAVSWAPLTYGIKPAAKKSSGSTSRSSSSTSTSNKCTYKYPDGSVCGRTCNKYANFCDQHFEELNETYNDVKSRLHNLE